MQDLSEAELSELDKCSDWRKPLTEKANIYQRYCPRLIAEVLRLRAENAELRKQLSDEQRVRKEYGF